MKDKWLGFAILSVMIGGVCEPVKMKLSGIAIAIIFYALYLVEAKIEEQRALDREDREIRHSIERWENENGLWN